MTTHALTLPERAEHPWLDAQLYPFAPKRWSSADGALSYVDEGSGPTVLFVHGTPSWSFELRHVIRALCTEHRCVAPDHLGFGLSDKPTGAGYRPEDHAERLKAFVRALDLRDVTLVVHDFGGPIGIPLALDLPERIARIVVLNSFLWPNAEDPAARKVDRVVRSALGKVLYRYFNVSPRFFLPAAFGDRRALTKAVHAHYVKPFAHRSDRESLYALARALLGSDPFYASLWARRDELASRLSDIVWGERDPAFGERHLRRWAEAFPRAAITRLPHAGHFIAEEAPDALVAVLRQHPIKT